MRKREKSTEALRPLSEAELRQMLLRTQQELLAKIRRERGGLQEGAVQLADAFLGDLVARPVLTPEAEIGYEIVDQQAHVLAQIELALKKLKDGTYGRCEACDEPIPAARLQALPFAIRCTRCQEAWERRRARESRYAGERAGE